MSCNIGKTDRVIRVILGVVIGALGIILHSWFGLIAIIPIGTAVMGFCPIYPLAKVNTCKK